MLMKPIRYFLSRGFDRATPSRLCRCTAWGLVALGCIAFATTAMTCSHTREGLEREQAIYTTGTNVVSHIQTLVPTCRRR